MLFFNTVYQSTKIVHLPRAVQLKTLTPHTVLAARAAFFHVWHGNSESRVGVV